MRTPTRQRIPIYRIEKRLADRLEEVVWRKIWLPQTFAGTEELV